MRARTGGCAGSLPGHGESSDKIGRLGNGGPDIAGPPFFCGNLLFYCAVPCFFAGNVIKFMGKFLRRDGCISEMKYSDIIIVGAGVVGCALARVLSRFDVSITVLERGCDVSEGASKANSGIVHAGFDAKSGSLKARFNVAGSRMYPELCAGLGVPYRRNGSLVLAFSDEERRTLGTLLAQGEQNGVGGLRIVEHDELLSMEPNVNPEVQCALYAPTGAIVSPYELVFALADHAAVNGVGFVFNEEVRGAVQEADGWRVHTAHSEYSCRILVNCAGTDSARLHNDMGGEEKLCIDYRLGQYWLLDHVKTPPFGCTVFQCPTDMGKGVLVSPTVHGNTLIGPTAEDVADALDTATTGAGLAEALEKSRRTWRDVSTRTNVTNFAGVRAHERGGDFVIGAVRGVSHAYEAVGIESPGLSSAPAIAEELGGLIAQNEGLSQKAGWIPAQPQPKPFNMMDSAERAEACRADALNGRIICRCETVTEAEIRRAIRRPVGATTVDGVKRRTRAGMGRCQGGFCMTRVAEILSEELGVPITEITKNGGDSRLLTSDISDALREEVK